jgi:Ala-tRNA(Pro) deacylase
MPLSEHLRGFLESHGVAYQVSTHPKAFTAREVATAEHLPARELAKTVVILGDGGYHMIVVPANKLIDFQEVRLALGFYQVRLATEEELGKLFPDCEIGAMPPFGPLWGLPVYLDRSLAGAPYLAFNAGTHLDVIHMRTEDFRNLVTPTIASLAREAALGQAW